MNKTESTKQMREFFREHDGMPINECDGPNGSTIYFINVDGRLILAQVFSDGGWEHWFPSRTNNLDTAHKEMAEFIGED